MVKLSQQPSQMPVTLRFWFGNCFSLLRPCFCCAVFSCLFFLCNTLWWRLVGEVLNQEHNRNTLVACILRERAGSKKISLAFDGQVLILPSLAYNPDIDHRFSTWILTTYFIHTSAHEPTSLTTTLPDQSQAIQLRSKTTQTWHQLHAVLHAASFTSC